MTIFEPADESDAYDEPITKRIMVELAIKESQDEDAIDAALRALVPGDLDDPEYRSELIDLVYRAWCVRLGKRSHPGGGRAHPTWRDVGEMFADVAAGVGVPYKKPRQRLLRGTNKPPPEKGSVISLVKDKDPDIEA